jgi:hypothetical protein
MAKAKASQQKKASFSVTKTDTVLQWCQNKLEPLLDKRELKFELLSKNPERHIFTLTTKDLKSSSTATDDRHNRHNVVPLLATKSDTYWINISLTFLPIFGKSQQKINPQSFQFLSISIRVFEERLMTDEKKQLLFRAEWDTLAKQNNHAQPRYNHAQPHWHVYKSFQIRDLTPQTSDFESLIQPNDVKDFGKETNNSLDNQDENDWDSSTKFHFAMSSQWHDGGTHKVVLDQEKLLYSWLVECVKYIKEQLQYVSGD